MVGPLQIVLGTICVLFLIYSVVLAVRAVRSMIRIIRTGQPDSGRLQPVPQRLKTLVVESLGHTRMLKWSVQGAAHWFVFVGFYGLFLTLVQAFGEVWNPAWELPVLGSFAARRSSSACSSGVRRPRMARTSSFATSLRSFSA